MRTIEPEIDEQVVSSGWTTAIPLVAVGIAILMILLGIIAIAFPFFASLTSTLLFGWVFIFAGITQIVYAFQSRGLEEYCHQATARNISTEYQHHFGEPGATISSIAQEWNADLIVLGRHDHSAMGYAPLEAIAEFFVGSVSNHVVDHANCSVLVIKDTNPDKDK